MANSNSWETIFAKYKIGEHDFNKAPFILTAEQIKQACQGFTKTGEKEVRILCKQDSREDVPAIMANAGLFLLPVKNGIYAIVQGEGYFDIPPIKTTPEIYHSGLDFELKSSKIGDSEMQHLDYAYAASLIRTFLGDETLVLTIRGRKYTPEFSFYVGDQLVNVRSVQTEVDAGYEGKDSIVLVEAKNSNTNNTIIRQLYYPYRQWKTQVSKDIFLLFFEKREDEYMLWQYEFTEQNNYNSIQLVASKRYRIEKKVK